MKINIIMAVLAQLPTPGQLPEPYAGGQVARGGGLGLLGYRDVMDTPFNQTSYTARLMEDQQARFVADVLSNDPTARADGSPSSGADWFSIRGFALGNGDIRFNGLAGVAPAHFNSMMSESIERVEVLKGPNAMIAGVEPLGGVGGSINVVSKRAPDQPLGRLTVDYTSVLRLGGHADVARRFGASGQFGLRFNGVYRDGDTVVDSQTRRSRLAALGLDYRGGRFRVSSDLAYQYQDLRGTRGPALLAEGIAVPRAPDNRVNFFDPFEFSNPAVLYGTVRGEVDLWRQLMAFVAVGGNRRNQRSIYSNRTITDALGTVAGGDVSLRADRMYGGTVEAGLRADFSTARLRHRAALLYALVGRQLRIATVPFTYQASNIYAPTYGPPPDRSLIPDPADASKMHELWLSSASLADTVSFLDERIQLTLAVRLQSIDSTWFDPMTGAQGSVYQRRRLTPTFALLGKPARGLSLYGNYAEGLQEGPIAPDTAVNAGQVFSPHVTRQVEVGAKHDFGRFVTTLSLYQIAQPSGRTNPASNLFGVDGEQRHRGVDLNFHGEVAWVRWLGGLAAIDSELRRTEGGVHDGNTGIGAPALRVVVGAEWDVLWVRGLTLSGRLIHNGGAYLDPANRQRVPGWSRWSAGARYGAIFPGGRAFTVRANLDNVLGASYWDASGYSLGQGEPRRFYLSAAFDI
jgi:iron complex outermembrane receptor protein